MIKNVDSLQLNWHINWVPYKGLYNANKNQIKQETAPHKLKKLPIVSSTFKHVLMRESTASKSVKKQPIKENILTVQKSQKAKALTTSMKPKVFCLHLQTFSYGGLFCMLADSVVSFPKIQTYIYVGGKAPSPPLLIMGDKNVSLYSTLLSPLLPTPPPPHNNERAAMVIRREGKK
jgi:hypothetical protein